MLGGRTIFNALHTLPRRAAHARAFPPRRMHVSGTDRAHFHPCRCNVCPNY
jgi:hypothetical protein